MRPTFLLAILTYTFIGCSPSSNQPSTNLELADIAAFALDKTVEFVVDSLHLKDSDLTFTEELPGIVINFSVSYQHKGTITFFFQRTSVIADTLRNNGDYLKKIKDKIIDEIKWEAMDRKKGSLKKVSIY